ncbi:MAG TPA: hypothetical protein P5274_02745, partial [Candidatus Paceibacterota bacterium]|nr:hypothetical protein [Candidatus Paceibacterota bacterium]
MRRDLTKEITWLKRDKYGREEVQLRGVQKLDFENDLERLRQGEPIDYVIGWKDFLGCRIDLSYRSLIPREETELWVGEVIREIKDLEVKPPSGSKLQLGGFTSKCTCLDLFAGSGCIGLAILKHCPNVEVTFA